MGVNLFDINASSFVFIMHPAYIALTLKLHISGMIFEAQPNVVAMSCVNA